MFRQQSEPRARRAHPGQRQRRARACGGRSGRGGGQLQVGQWTVAAAARCRGSCSWNGVVWFSSREVGRPPVPMEAAQGAGLQFEKEVRGAEREWGRVNATGWTWGQGG